MCQCANVDTLSVLNRNWHIGTLNNWHIINLILSDRELGYT